MKVQSLKKTDAETSSDMVNYQTSLEEQPREFSDFYNEIEAAIQRVIVRSNYAKDNLLCFACSLQPNF